MVNACQGMHDVSVKVGATQMSFKIPYLYNTKDLDTGDVLYVYKAHVDRKRAGKGGVESAHMRVLPSACLFEAFPKVKGRRQRAIVFKFPASMLMLTSGTLPC